MRSYILGIGITNPQGKNYPLVEARSLRLVIWKISSKVSKEKNFKQCYQAYLTFKEKKLNNKIRIGLGSVDYLI